MLNPYEASIRWKKILESVNRIQDPILRESFLAIYKERAIKEWRYCPDKKNYAKKEENIVLEPWQQEILKKLKLAKEYGVWIKDETTEKGFCIAMLDFVRSGGQLNDIPERLQSPSITKGYLKALEKFYG